MDFVERYPRSVVLREAYEQAARASAVLGDDDGAIEWGKRALRLLPENPFLQAMVADLGARRGQHQLAETSARRALRYMERAQRLRRFRPQSGRKYATACGNWRISLLAARRLRKAAIRMPSDG